MAGLPGVDTVTVNPVNFRLTVKPAMPLAPLQAAVADLGYSLAPAEGPRTETPPTFWEKHGHPVTTAVSGAAVLSAWWLSHHVGESHAVVPGLYVLAALVGGMRTFRAGWRSLRATEFDMNALMTIGILGAFAIGEWAEAASIAFLYALAAWLEAASMQHTRNQIRGLLDIAPQTARRQRAGEADCVVPVSELQVGDTVLVRPGEKFPIDGVVLAGVSAVNQAPITGESLPVSKAPGHDVFAGTINGNGALEVRVSRRVEDTTLARIVHLVEEAQGSRATVQRFVDRFARRYTPAVLLVALLMATVPPLAWGQPFSEWLYRALALIVLACPCALVISTPIALVAGIGNAARRGVLIKGGVHLESAARIRAVAFDKTGSLTQGQPRVQEVVALGAHDPAEVLRLAATVEQHSEHPLAAAILNHAASVAVTPEAIQAFEALVGHGAGAEVNGRRIVVASPRYFEQNGPMTPDAAAINHRLQAAGYTVVMVGDAETLVGLIAIQDPIRSESRDVVSQLKHLGVQQVVMLTGDHARTAAAIAQQAGVDDVRADMLPADKAEAVKALEARFGEVAMVGDGINDAPALAQARLGIAMGAAGSDVAIEAAHVALMSDNLRRIPFLIQLSRQTMRIIHQNIAFSLAVKAIATVLVFPGWLSLWMAVMSDMGATLVVIFNSLRILAVRPQDDAPQTQYIPGLNGRGYPRSHSRDATSR